MTFRTRWLAAAFAVWIVFEFHRAGPIPAGARMVAYDRIEQSIGRPTP